MSARPNARARREEARRLADLLKVDELADNPYVTRAVLMVAGTPVKAAARLAELRALLAETHEGDVGWEAEELAYAKALEAADRCACCGRAISADDSLEAGLGRTCRDNLATRVGS